MHNSLFGAKHIYQTDTFAFMLIKTLKIFLQKKQKIEMVLIKKIVKANLKFTFV